MLKLTKYIALSSREVQLGVHRIRLAPVGAAPDGDPDADTKGRRCQIKGLENQGSWRMLRFAYKASFIKCSFWYYVIKYDVVMIKQSGLLFFWNWCILAIQLRTTNKKNQLGHRPRNGTFPEGSEWARHGAFWSEKFKRLNVRCGWSTFEDPNWFMRNHHEKSWMIWVSLVCFLSKIHVLLLGNKLWWSDGRSTMSLLPRNPIPSCLMFDQAADEEFQLLVRGLQMIWFSTWEEPWISLNYLVRGL